MRDPFRPNTNKQLVREAQFGFTVIGLLIAILIYVAYYRLNGLGDITPPHIQNAPVAMQVFPSSPNYDHQTNLMEESSAPHRIAAHSNQPNFPTRKKESPLVSAPKRLMDDSQNTFRSLKKTAKSIEASAAKVQSLASVPKTSKPLSLVSNPAAERSEGSGFKITKKPKPDSATRSFSDVGATRTKDVPNTVAPPETNPIRSLLNQFTPAEQSTTPKTAPHEPPKVNLPPEFIPPDGQNDFKPSSVSSGVSPGRLSNLKQTRLLDARLNPKVEPKAEPSTNELRLTSEERGNKPKSETPSPVLLAPSPTVATVSFEETTWTVKKGDSFWSIAKSHYDEPRFFRALYEHNRRTVPGFENLTEGTVLSLPWVDELIRRHPELCPSDAVRKNDPWRSTPDNVMEKLTDACEADLDQRLYETKSGDTLFGIARRQLGQASRYVELLKLNEHRIDANVTHESRLPPGTQLLLPIK